MTQVTEDRVLETSTTTGTGAFTLAGAMTGFRTFASVCAVNDVVWYSIQAVDGSGAPTGDYESGLGTYSATNTLTRTTVIRSSNADATVNFAAGTKQVALTALASKVLQFNSDGVVPMPIASATPPVAATDTLSFYARKIAGRVMPKWMPPSGVDNCMQPGLFGNRILMFLPSNGTTGNGSGCGFGPAWNSAGTVSTPTPSSTSPAMSNQMKRSRYANVVTTTNQELGIRYNVVTERQFWRGNAAGLGGFFFVARFIVELYPASTVRIFAGLTGNTSTSVVISNTVLNDTCGLWHDTTDSSSTFNFVTRNTATTTKQAIALSNAIAAGNSYDFYMYAKPNDSTIYWQLDDLVNGVSYSGSTSTTLPTNTTFLQPQCAMSNGTANTTVTTTAIGIAGVYVESDH